MIIRRELTEETELWFFFTSRSPTFEVFHVSPCPVQTTVPPADGFPMIDSDLNVKYISSGQELFPRRDLLFLINWSDKSKFIFEFFITNKFFNFKINWTLIKYFQIEIRNSQ